MKNNIFNKCKIVVLLMAILFSYGCKNKSENEISLGYIPITDAGALYVAKEKGYFAEHNIKVELVKMSGGSLIINAIGTEDVQVGFSNTMSYLLAKSKGIDLVSMGGIAYNDSSSIEGAVLALENSKINSFKDLKNKKIAINARGNLIELSIRKILRENNLSKKNVNFIEIPFPQMESVLRSKQVDAITVPEPFWTYAEKTGGIKVIGYYFSDAFDRIEIASWYANKKWINENKELAKKLEQVFKKSVKFIENPNNESEFRNILIKYTNIDTTTSTKMRLPKFQNNLSNSFIQKLIKEMKYYNYLDESFSIDEINYK